MERQLSEKEIHEFEKHLSQCEACRKELEETRRLTETIKVVSSEQPKTGHFTSLKTCYNGKSRN
jgi:anti-sigma factor RsiW